MTKEEKELLLKDLCARLPYNLRVYDKNGNFNTSYVNLLHINGKVAEAFIGVGLQCRTAPIDEIRPYLFPLSSITKEQAEDLFKTFGLVLPSTEEDYIKINEVTGITFFLLRGFDVEAHLDKLVDWLNKNHFDWRGLIPIGLAIDATGLNIY